MSLAEPLDTPPWESPEWQEAVCQTPGLKPFFDNLESFVELPSGSSRNLVARIFRHQIEFAAVKQNPESVVGEGTKASCG
ncbi:hypothetical protein CA85_50040 [Allorhodopirellula solitaria]|uniref:Uncharacterized protein n=1 Tax=Allorhodopirellula solitaria TaxID=2527987 RepID=A0A5C5WXE0_9BACT|nr:hypothetical protein CA85_50040 [Allorhodopirellula solitaria]